MQRILALPLLSVAAAALLGCPSDKKDKQTGLASVPIDSSVLTDTGAADLSKVKTSLPPPAPDTFKPVRRVPPAEEVISVNYPNAPEPLMDAVHRSESFTKFCFQEFGQKADPTLSGAVAMLVTIGQRGVSDARVADARWSSSNAGTAVNRCLNQRAKEAWKVAPGAATPGKYVVQLSFRGS
jgi:hypothetical protein